MYTKPSPPPALTHNTSRPLPGASRNNGRCLAAVLHHSRLSCWRRTTRRDPHTQDAASTPRGPATHRASRLCRGAPPLQVRELNRSAAGSHSGDAAVKQLKSAISPATPTPRAWLAATFRRQRRVTATLLPLPRASHTPPSWPGSRGGSVFPMQLTGLVNSMHGAAAITTCKEGGCPRRCRGSLSHEC